jgi:SOS-response transcriptional repressor LexA
MFISQIVLSVENSTMDLIDEIERWRKSKGLKPADMARLFRVPAQNYNNWVYRKSLPKSQYQTAIAIMADAPASAVRESPSLYMQPVRRVPLISWVRAGEWCESHDSFEPGDAEEWLDCPVEFSEHAFCLKVIGDSMFAPGGYNEGEYILVDPAVRPRHGDDVVARTPEGKYTFKRLQITPEGTYLLALNPDHPNRKLEIPEDTHICGVVTASWKKRR